MLYAYSEATVPKITVVTRKAYGGSYLAMCSKDLGADMVFAWPTAEIAVMGPDGAANIIFKKEIDSATPYQAAKRGYVDDVIEPCETRQKVAAALNMLASKRVSNPHKKHGNFPV